MSKEKKNKGYIVTIIWMLIILGIIVIIFVSESIKQERKAGKVTVTSTPAPTGETTPSGKPSETPSPELTGIPTPESTATPTETPTPEPTATSTETPTPTPESDEYFISRGRKVYYDKPAIALTFDDGPVPWNAQALMDLFDEYGGNATFFLVGYFLDSRSDTAKSMIERGFHIGNHTLNHKTLTAETAETARKEIYGNEEKLRALGVEGTIYLRPPCGSYNTTISEMCQMPMIGWDIDSEDWKPQANGQARTTKQIIDNVLNNAHDGGIALCHELYDNTAEAMRVVIPELISRGYQLVSVEELFKLKRVTPENGKYYRNVK